MRFSLYHVINCYALIYSLLMATNQSCFITREYKHIAIISELSEVPVLNYDTLRATELWFKWFWIINYVIYAAGYIIYDSRNIVKFWKFVLAKETENEALYT